MDDDGYYASHSVILFADQWGRNGEKSALCCF